jgi:hypothetical protein
MRSLVLSLVLLTFGSSAFCTPSDSVRDGYRHFIMPTAKPIEGGYAGFWELAFLQAGYGFGDVVSVSGGFTIMPTVAFRSQFGFIQGKLTLYDDQGFSLATGINFLRMTSDWPYWHLFGVLTFENGSGTRYTGSVFYKLSGSDFPMVDVFPYGSFGFTYGGALGGGLGFDTPFPDNSNVRFIAEAWNHDISTPNKLALLGAFRVESERFSSDFGFIYFTLPLLAPVANFVWRF